MGRGELLELIQRRLLSAATSKNRPHTLLVGPRGSGKTHVVDVAMHRAVQQAESDARLAFVRLDEDGVGITRYLDVLQEVVRRLDGSHMHSRWSASSSQQPEADVARALGDRVLVLVIENLDRVFGALGEAGQQNLRSWVETSGRVMILATTPLIFPGVGDRSLPWYGNFGISYLEDLDLDQGRELLIHLARQSGDTALAEFLDSDRGQARLRAINALAGGSPRIWMILSECLTVQLLDDLVPAVEALLEGLVPYYQQLLWDLSGNEQRLVRELADGPHQAATVLELAARCGLEQRTAAATLGRLADLRWVRSEKAPDLDQRSSWYRLREPMLRHHFQYRASTGQPLTLIVELLRAWFDPSERREQLAAASPASEIERLMAATLGSELSRSDSAYANRDVDALLVEARRWLNGADAQSRTPEAGVLIDVAVTAARGDATTAAAIVDRRGLEGATARVAESLVERAVNLDRSRPEVERVGDLLRFAATSTADRTHAVIELVSACWDGEGEPSAARERLRAVDAQLPSGHDDPLRLDVQQAVAYWTGTAGETVEARDQFAALVPEFERLLGAEHPDTLLARHSLAFWTGAAGDGAAARDQFAALVPEFERLLGAEHPVTLLARHSLAFWTGAAGDGAAARDQFAALVPEFERLLGAEHPVTLLARHSLAFWTGAAGDGVTARDQFAALVPEFERLLGAEHPVTLLARHSLAFFAGRSGQPGLARDQFTALVPEFERVLGTEDPATLRARRNLALWTGEAGDAAFACDLAVALLADLAGQPRHQDVAGAVRSILQENVRRLLTPGPTEPEIDVAELGLAATLRAAVAGSAEALVRLPSELVEIVDGLRTA